MPSKLKYDPKKYARLAEVVGWLVAGKPVQIRGTAGERWLSFSQQMGEPGWLINIGCEFRIKP